MAERTELTGKVVVVTGAGSGVGRATALALAAAGARPVLAGRTPGPLDETVARIVGGGGRALAVPTDVADEGQVAVLAERAVAAFGGIDALVAAAGIGRFGSVEHYSLADWQATLATNLTGVFLASRAVLPALRERGGGHIVAVGSGAGKQGYADLAAYSASKFGVIGFMQALAAEVGGAGIKVSVVNPGSILTGFGGGDAAAKTAAAEADPGRKFLLPEDVAEAILMLLTQPARAWTQEMNLWPF
ncbi:MAG: SDR family oxidoreductase [Thermomicrobiales bacterium]|nr:SDR family oxidoreductase [Thermomicrobiales bacterium]